MKLEDPTNTDIDNIELKIAEKTEDKYVQKIKRIHWTYRWRVWEQKWRWRLASYKKYLSKA